MKLIAPEYARDQSFRQRFECELRLAASIDHQHVVLTSVPDDPPDRTRLVVVPDDRRVTGVQAGRLPEVELREGCLQSL